MSLFKFCFLAVWFTLILSGCSEKDEVLHVDTCIDRLDSRQYAAIADDTSCGIYERASAELGLGGVSVEKLLNQNVSDNLVDMFNIKPDTLETNKLHLQRAVTLTESITGTNRSITEIHLLAAVAMLINETWGGADSNLDGDIEESEFMDFMKIDPATTQVSGLSSFGLSDSFQLVDADDNAWIWVKDDLTWRSDTNYDGIADGGHVSLPASVSLKQVAFITEINELQSLFTTDSTGDIQESFDFLATSTTNARLVDQDLALLGLSANNSLREIINDSIDQIDNGATCRRSVVKIVNGFSDIVSVAATLDTASDYQSHNLLSLEQVQAVSSGTSFYIPTLPANIDIAGAVFKARIVYKKTGSPAGYVGLYQDADNNIKSPLNMVKFLTLDESGIRIESVQGDGIITLSELLCF